MTCKSKGIRFDSLEVYLEDAGGLGGVHNKQKPLLFTDGADLLYRQNCPRYIRGVGYYHHLGALLNVLSETLYIDFALVIATYPG